MLQGLLLPTTTPRPRRVALIAQFRAAANDTSVPPDWQRRYRWAIAHLGGAACTRFAQAHPRERRRIRRTAPLWNGERAPR